MENQIIVSPFKAHIDAFKSDLNQNAGRTTAEVRDLVKTDYLHKLSSNENALGPSPKAMAAIQKAIPNLHEYSYRTDERFRNVLAEEFNQEIKANQFITGNAGLELIDMIARGFLDEGKECIFSNPTFHVYEIFTKINGAKAVNVPLLEGSFELDIDGILDAVTEDTRLVIITNPNNPTGTMIPKSELDRLVYGLPEHVVLVHDEVYWHYADLSDFPFAQNYIQEGRNVIGLRSFSKAYGLAGLRVGYAFSTPKIAEYLNKLRRPFFINALSVEGAIAALGDKEHIKNTQALIATEKPFYYETFERLKIRYWKTHTNFILFDCPFDSVDEFIAQMLERGVMVRSGANNGAPGFIRVTIGVHEANIAFVKALEEVCGVG